MGLYRCEHCGKTFEADRPACKPCRIDPVADPRHAKYLTPLLTIHFDPPTHLDGLGRGHLACNPAAKVAGNRATGEPSVVNCAACRATAEWKAAFRGDAVIPPDLDEPLDGNGEDGAGAGSPSSRGPKSGGGSVALAGTG